ncbi:D-alanine--D-alanine ligase [Citrobacter rodentium]|uniref:D-alanine--D-alanine ligase n=2 Tax=Citrobacter rodentium TaxID=67825 RepID=D2TKW3_CITRI|nr:D-alanine--D-alanine ligase [Citrobacter rodentium]KIQ52759.1 D-alanine--D-alanine ligase [Citrobacter rodentium]QBY31650.1 D-alanine--D-alanine ligase [Citrobacter rodentium]UHO30992.1 D-alanine--D-alanine ligase [Citrobacter rodentium NBRC 105723 = DSM 16636]CBG87204.1 D-alanine:D-alanine ligase A [Citrobacter rodentium ICC168]HAT8015650.1 D-alanine--D-alanine ligase A [Citrobacter rodentium NBRC 105723 = DSM 16636]
MAKLRVGIVFGGKSAEHEVSLQSAKNIVDAIDKTRFEVVLLGIDKQGQWHVSDAANYLLNADDPAHIALRPSATRLAQVPGQHEHQLIDARTATPLPTVDVIFPIVHGTLGEDGSLQGMLRVANLPFVGSDVLGSAACMDKDVTKRLLRDTGLNIAPFVTLSRANRHTFSFADIKARLGLPLFVKPANQGSSVGVSKVTNEAQYAQAVALAFEFDHKVVVEQGIVGREIECAVLGNDRPQASTCGEIVLNSDFYAYDTKYIDDNGAKVVVPATIDPQINDKIRDIAIQAYQTLGCAGMARVDVFLTAENEVVINEINTLPGFTNISMYPKLWQASGLSYTDLISRLIELALERHAADNALKTTI